MRLQSHEPELIGVGGLSLKKKHLREDNIGIGDFNRAMAVCTVVL